MATVAIGDIHGNLTALNELLGKVVPGLRQQDTLVFLGDYIDRGPDSKGCVERIVQLRQEAPFSIVTLMGNHEQWMLRTLHDAARHSWLLGMGAFDTIQSYSCHAAFLIEQSLAELGPRIIAETVSLPYEAFFSSMPPKHREFFENLVPFHKTDDVICVHGGVGRDGALDSQDLDTYIWGPPGFPKDYAGSDIVVYGHRHDAIVDDRGAVRPRVGMNRTYGIDTISHGVLTAIRFPGAAVLQAAPSTAIRPS